MNKTAFPLCIFFIASFHLIFSSTAMCEEKIHPVNIKLVKAGLMPYPKYYPSVPRVMANVALALFQANRARIAWIGDDGMQVIGAYHFRENEVKQIPKTIKLAKNQILLLY